MSTRFNRRGHYRTNANGTTFYVSSHEVEKDFYSVSDKVGNILVNGQAKLEKDFCRDCYATIFSAKFLSGKKILFNNNSEPLQRHACKKNKSNIIERSGKLRTPKKFLSDNEIKAQEARTALNQSENISREQYSEEYFGGVANIDKRISSLDKEIKLLAEKLLEKKLRRKKNKRAINALEGRLIELQNKINKEKQSRLSLKIVKYENGDKLKIESKQKNEGEYKKQTFKAALKNLQKNLQNEKNPIKKNLISFDMLMITKKISSATKALELSGKISQLKNELEKDFKSCGNLIKAHKEEKYIIPLKLCRYEIIKRIGKFSEDRKNASKAIERLNKKLEEFQNS